MRFPAPCVVHRALVVVLIASHVVSPTSARAQRDVKAAPAAIQAFDVAECRSDCVLDTLAIDVDRGRRASAGTLTASLLLIDTLSMPKRGAPPTPRELPLAVWMSCDSTPCGAALVSGRVTDKRLDDTRVSRRVTALWTLPAPLLAQLMRSAAVNVVADGRVHTLSATMLAATRNLIESVRTTAAAATYSARMKLYVATFALFGTPGDSTMAEDVGTATEPLMIPDATSPPPTRVATLTIAGRGGDALPVLVQDDATGAAPIFGIGETVSIALPGRVGRRGVIGGRIAARQRVEKLRDACQGTKLWTYLVTMPATDLAMAQRGALASPRADEAFDRWNGTAVREAYPARLAQGEQRSITASRPAVAQFVKESAASGLRERDVQVLAALPKGAGYVTNFGVIAKVGGSWMFPAFSLRPSSCAS